MPTARTQFARSTSPVFSYNPTSPGSFQQQLGQFYGIGRPPAGVNAPGTMPGVPTMPGTLPGLPGYGGSPAAGQKPVVPDPGTTARDATLSNLANIPNLRTLFNQVGGTYIPGFENLSATEAQNISDLLSGKYNVPEAFRRTAEMGTSSGLAGSDAQQVAEILWHRRYEDEARKEGARRFSEAATRSKSVLDLEKLLETPEGRQAWQWIANQVAAAPDPEKAFERALQLVREGITRGLNTTGGGGPPTTLGGGGPTTLGGTSPVNDILKRYSGGTTTPPPPASGGPPGWGFLRPSDGGPGFGTGGDLPFTIPSGGFPLPSDVPYWFSGDPMDIVGPPGGYSSPGEVPYWYQGDPMDLVNPNA